MKKYLSIILTICILCSMTFTVSATDADSDTMIPQNMPGISLNAIETVCVEPTDESIENNVNELTADDKNVENEGLENSEISTLSLGQPAQDTWSAVGNLNIGRADCDTTVVNNELYIIGGLSSNGYSDIIEKYNVDADVWEEVTTIPNALKGYSVASCNENIYIIGGCEGNTYSRTVQIYNTSSGEWSEAPRMIRNRADAAAVAVDDKIYVFGGEDAFGLVNSYEYYDLTEGKWTLISSEYNSLLNRIGADAYYLNGYLFMLGGVRYNGDITPSCYYSISDLNTPHSISDKDEFQAMVVGKDKALFIAGDDDSNLQIAKEIIVDNGEVSVTNTSINSVNTSDAGASYILYNGYIYRIGGYTFREYSSDVYKYSLFYGDFSVGGGQVENNRTEYGSDLVLDVESGHDYLIFLNVENMSDINEYEFTIEYIDNSFNIADVCAFTQYRETSKGNIRRTDLTVTEKKTNGMSFVTSEIIPSGKTVTKTVNAIILRANLSGQRTIKYSMAKK